MSNVVPLPKTKKKTTSTLVQYKDAYLVQYKDGVDIVDSVTGKNRWSKTMRAAKWCLTSADKRNLPPNQTGEH